MKNQDRDDTRQCTLHAARLVLDPPAPIAEAKWEIEAQQTGPVSPAHLNAPMTQAVPWHNVQPVNKSANTPIFFI
jgi:hypothetical protein